MHNLWHAHNITENVSGDGRKNTPRAEKEVRTMEAKKRGVT